MDGQAVARAADRLVGRTHELRQLRAAFAAAREGHGSVTVVSGEPGIGKTRLCEEAASLAGAMGLQVVTARCWPDGSAPAFWPWQPILRSLCGEATAAQLSVGDADRFSRFVAIVDQLEAASVHVPVCLVVDDVHAADAPTLLLARFVARALPRLRMVLVLSRRAGEPTPGSLEARLLDDIEAEASPLPLATLDLAESLDFLDAHGLGHLDPALARTVVRITMGNPLYLRRIAALGVPRGEGAVPEQLQIAIQRSLQELRPDTQRILRASAVLGLSVAVREAAAVAATDPAAVLDAVGDAARVGLVSTDGTDHTDRFGFAHELVRATFEAGLTAADRLDAHARAAAAVAGPQVADGARRAHHALAAAPRSPDDARIAVDACRTAARSMLASFAYEQADHLLSAAVGLHDRSGLGPPPGCLLVEWAQAASFSGRMAEARRRFDRAATTAEHEADPIAFAEAALGLGGVWLNEHRSPLARARVLGLQRAALHRLPAGDDPDDEDAAAAAPLRARLEVRLAGEAVYDGAPVEPVLATLEGARACGDAGALAEALSLCHHALLAPAHADRRLALADELIQVASRAGHGVLGLMGLCWRAVDLFLAGDGRAIRALEELRAQADALACQNVMYIVRVIDVMLMIRAGRLDDAATASQHVYELGHEVGEEDAFGYLGAHTLAIRFIQGSDSDLVDLAESVAGSTSLIEGEFSLRASAAAIAARAGQHDRARIALGKLTKHGLAALPPSSTWLMGMVAIAETAGVLGDAAVAEEAYELLHPYAGVPTMPSLAVVCLGSTERALGTAAEAFGDLDLAARHLVAAIEANRRIANWPLVAICQAQLAGVLVRIGGRAAAERAEKLLHDAIAAADEFDMPVRAAAWRAELNEVVASGAAPPPARDGALRRSGKGWLVAVDGHRAFVGNLVGLRYLARLLRHPGHKIPAVDLAGDGPFPQDGSPQALLDDEAKAAYGARMRELGAELAEAQAHADLGRAEVLRAELDVLVDQLEAAVGLHGQSRTFAGPAERARTAVRKAIKRAIDEIDGANPVVGQALRTSIVTGLSCAYLPDPTDPITWSVTED